MNDRAHEAITHTTIEQFFPALELDLIKSSPSNPRKRFDQAAMDELIASVKEHGVVTPVLVRLNPSGTEVYELVFGERRYRAALAAGLTTIPATVRPLTDVQVIEIQIIENLQRADVHPIEEAEGYERLMQQAKPGGDKFTADDIAAKVGKSRRYVYNRLQLTKLCPEAREAFYDGKIDIKKAEAISRIAHHDTQRSALKAITKADYSGQPMSSRDAARLITREYMLELGEAPFDIKIVDYKTKGKVIAGPCGTCPKRTGNAPDLFDDADISKDTCTDIKCYHAKRDAHIDLEADGFRAKGLIVHTGKEAAAILADRWGNGHDAWLPHDKYDYTAQKKVGDIVGKAIQPLMVRRDDMDEWVKVYPKAEVHALMEKKGIGTKADKAKSVAAATGHVGGWPQQVGYNNSQLAARGWQLVRSAYAAGAQGADVRFLINCAVSDLFDFQGDLDIIGPTYAPELWNGGDGFDWHVVMKACTDTIEKLPNEALPQALLDLTAQKCIDSGSDIAGLLELIKRHGQTEKKITKQLDEDKKARDAAKAAAFAPTAPVTPESEAVVKKAKKVKAA